MQWFFMVIRSCKWSDGERRHPQTIQRLQNFLSCAIIVSQRVAGVTVLKITFRTWLHVDTLVISIFSSKVLQVGYENYLQFKFILTVNCIYIEVYVGFLPLSGLSVSLGGVPGQVCVSWVFLAVACWPHLCGTLVSQSWHWLGCALSLHPGHAAHPPAETCNMWSLKNATSGEAEIVMTWIIT